LQSHWGFVRPYMLCIHHWIHAKEFHTTQCCSIRNPAFKLSWSMIVTGALPLNNGLFPCTHIHFMTQNAVVKWCCYPGIHRPFLEAAPSNISYIMSRDDLSR
jgi:hypothetical protein